MTPIAYFKLQAKNLFKDYKTKTPYTEDGETYYEYTPIYFDVDRIVLEHELDEENFSLMNAQHVIAYMAGFRKWTDLIKASAAELELAKLVFDNQDKIGIEEWQMYIGNVENDNRMTFDAKSRLEIFKQAFANVNGHENPFGDYRMQRTN